MSDEARRNLIAADTPESGFSSTAANTPATFSSPISPRSPPSSSLALPRHRPTYARLASNDDRGLPEEDEEGEDIAETFARASSGIGLDIGPQGTTADVQSPQRSRRVSIQSIPRKSVGAGPKSVKINSPPLPYNSGSPQSSRASISHAGTAYEGPQVVVDRSSPEPGEVADRYRHISKPSLSSLSETHEMHDLSDTEPLKKKSANASRTSLRSAQSGYEHDFDPRNSCPAAVSFEHSRFNWLGFSILVLSIFSTIFSGIYFVIAVRAPRYGHFVGTNANLSAPTASILTTLFAKLIELSYVTVVVAFLGQALSRRAFSMRERGVSLAELFMRTWIMQPGSIITNFQTLRYAAFTVLGAVSLTATLAALLYTTAADALVAPQLRFSKWEPKLMQGPVMTSFGNAQFLQAQCPTPIQKDITDGYNNGGAACVEIEHAANAYNNYKQYMSEWNVIAGAGNGSTDIAQRPLGFGLLNENTTVTAAWVQHVDVANASLAAQENGKFPGRIVNNVSLAMPHAGVSLAVYDQRNDILQPNDLDGLGIYSLRASVPSPVVNVLCVNVEEDDIAPIVYPLTDFGKQNNVTFGQWVAAEVNYTALDIPNINTTLNDIFEWGPQYGPSGQAPPIFFKVPLASNTILNNTFQYGRQSIYLLGKANEKVSEQLVLCRIRASLTPFCSTNMTVTASGAKMAANCEDQSDGMAYIRSLTNATSGNSTINLDWPWIASDWGTSISLNDGINDGNSSNARMLTDLILATPELDRTLPSPAEALAVMSGCTLLMSSAFAPFVQFYNYSTASLEIPAYQFFNATIRAQQYASGGVFAYQRAFYAVLFIVFFSNILVLFYFVAHRGLVTDFTESPNLFTLAVNSPPSQLVAGSCGGGPHGEQYNVHWRVTTAGEHLYMTSEEGPKGFKGIRPISIRSYALTSDGISNPSGSPISRVFSRYRGRKSIL